MQWKLDLTDGVTLGDSDTTLESLASQFPWIAKQALNRTATFTRARVIEKITDVYNVTPGVLRDTRNIRVVDARSTLTAKVTATGRRLPLVDFGARQTRQGVTIMVKRSGGRKLIPHAFIARMQSGHEGLFLRVPGAKVEPTRGRYAGTGIKRQKIEERFSLSVGQMMIAQDVYAEVEEQLAAFFHDEFIRRLGVYLSTGH